MQASGLQMKCNSRFPVHDTLVQAQKNPPKGGLSWIAEAIGFPVVGVARIELATPTMST